MQVNVSVDTKAEREAAEQLINAVSKAGAYVQLNINVLCNVYFSFFLFQFLLLLIIFSSFDLHLLLTNAESVSFSRFYLLEFHKQTKHKFRLHRNVYIMNLKMRRERKC